MPDFQYDRKRFVEPSSLRGLERATRRNAYDIDNKATQTPTDGGDTTTPTTLIGPGGTLITPPVISGPDGYPIPRDLSSDAVLGDLWYLLDGTQRGWFARTLLTRTAAGTTAINLDNTAQRYAYPLSVGPTGLPLTVRAGQLWAGARYWSGTAWVLPTTLPVTHVDGTTGTITGSTLNTALTGWHIQVGGYTYFVASVTMGGSTSSRLCRMAHGSTDVQSVSPSLVAGSSGAGTGSPLYGIEGGYAWMLGGYRAGQGGWDTLFCVELGTQTLKAFGTSSLELLNTYRFGSSSLEQGPLGRASFVLTDGRLAYLSNDLTDGKFGLRTLSFGGNVTVQAAFYPQTRMQSTSLSGCPIPGGNAKLIPTNVAGVFDNLTPQGWQEVTIPALAGSTVSNASVRWKDQAWGTTLQWTTGSHLYEGSIAS